MMEDPRFERASSRQGDPVGRLDGDWGFWDESWSTWHGGYADEAAARDGVRTYALSL